MEKFVMTPAGVTLWTESFGNPQNPAVLLMAGAMQQGVFWPEAFCQRFADAGYYVLRYDYRDTGMSSVVEYQQQPYVFEDLAEDALAILDSYMLDQAHIVGFSMGGCVGQLLGVLYPERVLSLVLMGTTADHRPMINTMVGNQVPDECSLPKPADRFIHFIENDRIAAPKNIIEIRQNLLNAYRAVHGGSTAYPVSEMEALVDLAFERANDITAAAQHVFAQLNSPHTKEFAKQLSVPALVLHGKHDPIMPVEHGRYLADIISDARLVELDMGHVIVGQALQTIIEEIMHFYRTLNPETLRQLN